LGFKSLAVELHKHKTIIIEGYQGVFYENIRKNLEPYFQEEGIKTNWINVSNTLKTEDEINKLIAPFLGGDDPIFGTRTTLELADFFQHPSVGYPILSEILPNINSEPTICKCSFAMPFTKFSTTKSSCSTKSD
jgi:hypothetical protein